MLGILLAFFLFAGPVVQKETGFDALSYGPEKLCEFSGGKYDGVSEVGGTGKEAIHAHVPYCTALPFQAQIGGLIDKVKAQ